MLALRDYTTKSYKGRMVAAKWGMRIKDKFLARWQEQMFVAQKLNRMCSIMQEQNYLTFIRAFMLKLEDAGEYMQLRKKLNMKLKAKAWQIFKQDWLLGRMAKSLNQRYLANLQRKVLFALRSNQFSRIGLREAVM